MYVIEVHCGFLIAEFEPKYRNCRLTKEHAEALTFKTKKQAKAFIMEHIGEGTNSTSQVVPQQVPIAITMST